MRTGKGVTRWLLRRPKVGDYVRSTGIKPPIFGHVRRIDTFGGVSVQWIGDRSSSYIAEWRHLRVGVKRNA